MQGFYIRIVNMIQSFNGKTPRISESVFVSESAHIIDTSQQLYWLEQASEVYVRLAERHKKEAAGD
jgi:hypothetical protein